MGQLDDKKPNGKNAADHSAGATSSQRESKNAGPPGGSSKSVPFSEQVDLTNQQIGRYLIQRLLGTGGVAAVYQAYDQVLGQTVALKVLPPTADSNTLMRFRREAMTSGALRHPHIVRTIQVGVAPKGDIAYIAMELIEGDSLADLLARVGRLHPEESCNLLFPIASALAHAHGSGIVHRDVKPSNILLRPASYGDKNSVQIESLEYPVVPLLSDFGIARSLDSPELTNQGRTVGTPAYMAPEQCAGSRNIDGRADIYALGTVLFRCVAGRPPFSGTTTQILHAHVYEPVTIDDEILSRLPPLIVDIFQKSLAKQSDERYADAKEMAVALAVTAGRQLPAELSGEDEQADERTSGPQATSTMTMSSLSSVQRKPTPVQKMVLVPGSITEAPATVPPLNKPLQRRALSTSLFQRLENFKWGNLAFAGMAAILSAVLTALLIMGFANYRSNSNNGAFDENDASAQIATATGLAIVAVTETATIEATKPLSPTLTETATESPSPTASDTATIEPTPTQVIIVPTTTPTEIPTATDVPTLTATPTWTLTPTAVLTQTITLTVTATTSTTSTPTLTPTNTGTPSTPTWTPGPATDTPTPPPEPEAEAGLAGGDEF